MTAIGKYVIVKNLEEEDVSKTSGGIYIANKEKPSIGHYEIISIDPTTETNLKNGDKVWAFSSCVSKSINLDKSIGIVKLENIMAID